MAAMSAFLGGSLYDLIFKQILGLSQCTGTGGMQFGCVTGEVVHDFIFALFLPHIVIVIFLFLFSDWAHLRKHHKGLSSLLGIGAYVFIIYAGWYGIIATFGMWWLALGIVLSFFNFLWSRVIHPTKTGEVIKAAKGLGESLGEGAGKRKKLNILRKRERRLQNKLDSESDPDTRKVYAERLEKVRAKIEELEGR